VSPCSFQSTVVSDDVVEELGVEEEEEEKEEENEETLLKYTSTQRIQSKVWDAVRKANAQQAGRLVKEEEEE